jgi:SAM-dependent methyltransferase
VSPKPPDFDPVIDAFYQESPEEERLEREHSRLELLRTRELIQRFAPRPPATVYDVGGGAGPYAFWLADAGYEVHLVDASSRLVDEARLRNRERKRPLASCDVGDARSTAFGNATADIVLLLGPLYHLTERADRVRALGEVARVLKPGGIAFAAAISRFASALDGLSRDLFADPAFNTIVERDLREGQHRNPTGKPDYFTTAFFHHPDELRSEGTEAGLTVDGVYGIEGPGWILPDAGERLKDDRRREDLLRVARTLESEPSVLGISAHLMLVAYKTN